MGISGLLPLLKKASKNSHVRKFSGCTVAIDAYCWLHKGAFGCAQKLGMGEPTTAYITYCMKYIQVLLDNKIKPILVLDGRNLPSKEHTEKKRREKRRENRENARKFMQQGKKKEAWECFTRCVDITPAMAREFIKVLRSMKIDYVVAPYEADAQLAYLAKTGIADIIITEDSDLVLFGCPRVFFKMNVNGDGVFFDQSKLPQCLGLTPSKFNFDHFRWMCILSGCDYLPSIPGIGLGRAQKVVIGSNHVDIRKMILSIPDVLVKVQVEVTEEYIAGFIQAEKTFLYQLVFDTHERKLLPLNPYPDNLGPEDLPFAGSYATSEIAVDLALGNIDLHSLKTVDCFEPLKSNYPASSIWSSSFVAVKRDFTEKDLKAASAVGMQISIPAVPTSKKKRPLTDMCSLKLVMNFDNEDNSGPNDTDLMEMYAGKMDSNDTGDFQKFNKNHKSNDSFSSDEEVDVKPSLPTVDETDSPSNSKRRRITRQREEENGEDTQICNLRSKSRALPFLKSPQDPKQNIHVKSKYFREEAKTVVKKEIKDSDDDNDSDDALGEEMLPELLSRPRRNIYSYDSSQESALSDISASQRSSGSLQTSQENNSESSLLSSLIKNCSVVIKKTDIPEITLDKEEDAEESTSNYFNDNSLSRVTRSNSSSSLSPNVLQRPFAKTPANASTKSTFRRPGLSRSGKKDSKQPSVRDMFTRQKSVV